MHAIRQTGERGQRADLERGSRNLLGNVASADQERGSRGLLGNVASVPIRSAGRGAYWVVVDRSWSGSPHRRQCRVSPPGARHRRLLTEGRSRCSLWVVCRYEVLGTCEVRLRAGSRCGGLGRNRRGGKRRWSEDSQSLRYDGRRSRLALARALRQLKSQTFPSTASGCCSTATSAFSRSQISPGSNAPQSRQSCACSGRHLDTSVGPTSTSI